jgi:hypothetical protein
MRTQAKRSALGLLPFLPVGLCALSLLISRSVPSIAWQSLANRCNTKSFVSYSTEGTRLFSNLRSHHAERAEAVAAFQDGRIRVVLLTFGPGSVGTTLTRANTVCFAQRS